MSAIPHVALLRGINVGGHNRIRMAELRELCAELGWQDVRTYIQSGNLVFSAAGSTSALELQLERAIDEHLGLSIPVLVRTGRSWSAHIDGNPFTAESSAEPKRVALALSKQKPAASARRTSSG